MSRSDAELKTAVLQARDRRGRDFGRALGLPEARGAASFLVLSTNVPGEVKQLEGLGLLARGALDAAVERLGLKVLVSGSDQLGPFHIGCSRRSPAEAKRVAMALETETPAGRLLDLDVYSPDGVQADRPSLGFQGRACLLCAEPARECMLLQRHSVPELLERVRELLRPWTVLPTRIPPERLALALHHGALRELYLTPKPGLVDRRDAGSHSDLSYPAMYVSAHLLPRYYDELLWCFTRQLPLQASVQAGRDAEDRMLRQIRSNGHKGYIFLSGLVLMAACECRGEVALLPDAITATAARFFREHAPADTHGARLRAAEGRGGLREEAELGLPAVFEHGWPKYRQALDAGWSKDHAAFYLMAVLMQQVEDTTTLRRCGPEGLDQIRQDGGRLQRLLEQRTQAPEPLLAAMNKDYRQVNLTMGGVADCMALTFALQEAGL